MRLASKLRFTILAASITLIGGAWLYAQVFPAAVHPLDLPCANCHLAGADTQPGNASMLVTSQEQMCAQCHANSTQMSHPSGITPPPGSIIPATYPLDWKGDLTCSTCHEVHSDQPGKLRGSATGRDLCLACHTQAFFDNMPDGGVSMVQSGHLGAPNAQNWQNLDPYSIQCMDCHGTKGDVNIDPNQVVRHGSLNHPVGANYDTAFRSGGYKAALLLPKKIMLPNGMVACVSCHEGYKKAHGQLVTAGTGNSLCYQCHDI
ncbi:MAG: cytochrome c3 family protein [Pseudomonadota bacterium]